MNSNYEVIIPKYEDVKTDIFKIIFQNYSLSDFAFFIREQMFQKTDYIELKEAIFQNMTIDNIVEEIKKFDKDI